MNEVGSPARTPELVEHFFRHESGRLTAVLTRRFGAARLGAIEDAVQSAFERALGTWPRTGVPDQPAAWLTRVATNRLIDQLRREQQAGRVQADDVDESAVLEPGEDMLSMLFACADERLVPRARLILCLKLLCGFSTKEISARLFMTGANVQKVLERGRERLKSRWHRVDELPRAGENVGERLSTVQQVLYLLFNEGASPAEDVGLRIELCEEAIRLTQILATHPVGDRPSTWALLALMHLHSARLATRVDDLGQLVALPDQDRARWDWSQVARGLECMQRATRDDSYSRYHGEAAIQVEHVIAPDFASTRWREIVSLYETLELMQPSPVYALNRAIALAEADGPRVALAALHAHPFPAWFQRHYLFHGALGELHRRLGDWNESRRHLRAAMSSAPSDAEKLLFRRRIDACGDAESGGGESEVHAGAGPGSPKPIRPAGDRG